MKNFSRYTRWITLLSCTAIMGMATQASAQNRDRDENFYDNRSLRFSADRSESSNSSKNSSSAAYNFDWNSPNDTYLQTNRGLDKNNSPSIVYSNSHPFDKAWNNSSRSNSAIHRNDSTYYSVNRNYATSFHIGFSYRTHPNYSYSYVPIGSRLRHLPTGFLTFFIGTDRYFYHDHTYYRWDLGYREYVVVGKPHGASAFVNNSSKNYTNEIFVYPNLGQSEQQIDFDRYECYVWAMEQSGYDPSITYAQRGSSDDYWRANSVCLEGRGYTVG